MRAAGRRLTGRVAFILATLLVLWTAVRIPGPRQPSSSSPVDRPHVPYAARQEQVTFSSQGEVLSGVLWVPPGRSPHPAFILLQGSGPEGIRAEMTPSHPFWLDIADHLLRRGFAVLAFDKAGTGGSTGDWRRQDFTARARDALAAVDYLRSRPEIDGGRVGLAGHSQGGYIAQRAAALDPGRVAFVILLAGPAVSVREQVLDDLSSTWRCRGNPGWLVAAKRHGMNTALAALGLIGRVAPAGYLGRIIHHDPAGDIKALSQPVLALFAGNDRLVEAEKNARRLEVLLQESSSPAWFIRQVPGADHFFRSAAGLCQDWAGERWRWAPGFWDALDTADFWRAIGSDRG